MKRPNLALLLALLALTSCGTMHNAAVSTFRVVDAPHQYVRRALGVDEEQPQNTTTTTQTTVYSDTSGYPPSQRYPAQQPAAPPPGQTQRRIVTREREPSTQAVVEPTATPSVSRRETVAPESTTAPQTTSTQSSDLPYAKPVPGKPGYVFSPYDKNGGYVDVTGYNPGQKVKDPYSGKIFLVP